MMIQHHQWCAECEVEWSRRKGDVCPECNEVKA